MIPEALAGLGAFKTMYDLAKGLKEISDATIRNGAVIELQEKILSARDAQSALLEKVSTLETEMARLKAWDADKQRYELKAHGEREALAYALKPSMENGEPPHSLCPDCYQQTIKSIAQPLVRSHGHSHLLICHRC